MMYPTTTTTTTTTPTRTGEHTPLMSGSDWGGIGGHSVTAASQVQQQLQQQQNVTQRRRPRQGWEDPQQHQPHQRHTNNSNNKNTNNNNINQHSGRSSNFNPNHPGSLSSSLFPPPDFSTHSPPPRRDNRTVLPLVGGGRRVGDSTTTTNIVRPLTTYNPPMDNPSFLKPSSPQPPSSPTNRSHHNHNIRHPWLQDRNQLHNTTNNNSNASPTSSFSPHYIQYNKNKNNTSRNSSRTTDDDDGGKSDRRNWTQRMVHSMTQQLQKHGRGATTTTTTTTTAAASAPNNNNTNNALLLPTATNDWDSAGWDSALGTTGDGSSREYDDEQGTKTTTTTTSSASGGGGRRRRQQQSGQGQPPSSASEGEQGSTSSTTLSSLNIHDLNNVDNNDNDDDIDSALYYEDTYNDLSWKCSWGTREDDGIWMNTSDRVGTLMAVMVWILFLYSMGTMMLLSQRRHVSQYWAAVYITIATLALACHAKTTFTDPGAVASSAVPLVTKGVKFHAMCSICQSYKPKYAHHCRICNRCVTRMDHHCPWMNNCVGAGNLKHFILFLLYTWLGSGIALLIFLINYFGCNSTDCEFTTLEIQLVRLMSVIALASWLFTSSMIMSIIYGIITGIGTIDRLKKKATHTWYLSDEEALPLCDVVGRGPWWTWILPMDPFFPDYDRVMGYATMQRLLREQSMAKQQQKLDHQQRRRQ